MLAIEIFAAVYLGMVCIVVGVCELAERGKTYDAEP